MPAHLTNYILIRYSRSISFLWNWISFQFAPFKFATSLVNWCKETFCQIEQDILPRPLLVNKHLLWKNIFPSLNYERVSKQRVIKKYNFSWVIHIKQKLLRMIPLEVNTCLVGRKFLRALHSKWIPKVEILDSKWIFKTSLGIQCIQMKQMACLFPFERESEKEYLVALLSHHYGW